MSHDLCINEGHKENDIGVNNEGCVCIEEDVSDWAEQLTPDL